jgi:hypothetical protein
MVTKCAENLHSFLLEKYNKCGYEIRFENMTRVRAWHSTDEYYFCNQCIQEKKDAIQLIDKGAI